MSEVEELQAEVERLRGPFRCCEHCKDDVVHDVEPNQHEVSCQLCDDRLTRRAESAERARDAALAEVTELRDRLGRVEALRDRWLAVDVPSAEVTSWSHYAGAALRAALAVPVTGDTEDASPAAEDGQPDQERGLYGKYRVERISDPTGKHADCRYFVLDPQHDRHAHAALAFYAAEVESEYPQLADDIDVWLMGAASPTEQATEGGAK